MKTHRFDGVSFFSGFVLTLIGLLFLLPSQPSDLIDFVAGVGSWFWPVLFLAVGSGVLVPILMPSRRQATEESEDEPGTS